MRTVRLFGCRLRTRRLQTESITPEGKVDRSSFPNAPVGNPDSARSEFPTKTFENDGLSL
jgi:hypothetical protein